MTRIDVHQHLWTEPLIAALADRRELPYVRRHGAVAVLHAAGERPYVVNTSAESPARRAALLESDGVERALLCLSSPLGIESLARDQSAPLLEAFHDGALALGDQFGVWAAVALDEPDPDDIDRALGRGCVGVSLPAGALGAADDIERLRALLERMEAKDLPLFIHPGPGVSETHAATGQAALSQPLWWPALTRYVAQMQAAWLAFVVGARMQHPRLRVIFAMLAGMAPLHVERLCSRGGPAPRLQDPLIFYDTSSYGALATRSMAAAVGATQLLYGSDRPVVEPAELHMSGSLDWSMLAEVTRRALAPDGQRNAPVLA